MTKEFRVKNMREIRSWQKKIKPIEDIKSKRPKNEEKEMKKIKKELKIIDRTIINIMARLIKLEINKNMRGGEK